MDDLSPVRAASLPGFLLRSSDPGWLPGQPEPPRQSSSKELLRLPETIQSEDSGTATVGGRSERSSTTDEGVSEGLAEQSENPLRQPIQVQLAARVYYIMDSGADAWSGDNHAEELLRSVTCRFSLHMKWTDRYYQYPHALGMCDMFNVKGSDGGVEIVPKEKLVHYSTHPEVGHRAVPFPDRDMSMQGVEIPRHGLPRWTPEIKFFDAMEEPRVIRCEYSADRSDGTVQCFYEATGTFLRAASKELRLCIGTQHRKKNLIFVPHQTVKHENLTMKSPAYKSISRQATEDCPAPAAEPSKPPDSKAAATMRAAAVKVSALGRVLVPLGVLLVGVLAAVVMSRVSWYISATILIAISLGAWRFDAKEEKKKKEEEKEKKQGPELEAYFTVEDGRMIGQVEGTAHFVSIKAKSRNPKYHQATFHVPAGRKPAWRPLRSFWRSVRGNPGSTIKYFTVAGTGIKIIKFLKDAYDTLVTLDVCQYGMLQGLLIIWGVCEDA